MEWVLLGLSNHYQKPSAAVKYYEKAAALGNAFALTNLGYCFYVGIGVKQDRTKAALNYFNSIIMSGKTDTQRKDRIKYLVTCDEDENHFAVKSIIAYYKFMSDIGFDRVSQTNLNRNPVFAR